MGGETSNLVSQLLRRDDGNFFSDLLVVVEVITESGVVFFDNQFSGLLDGFSSDSSLYVELAKVQ
jgi:hypothetical protein